MGTKSEMVEKFKGKTIQEVKISDNNFWILYFSDGTNLTIEAKEKFGQPQLFCGEESGK